MNALLLSPVNFVAIGIGAMLGAWLRWLLGIWFNTHAAAWPWGTLAANLIGAYLIGLVLGLVAAHPDWPAWIRLAAATGFLGALTTFSTFSAETISMLETGKYALAAGYVAFSLAASLILTVLGLYSAHALR